MCKRIFEFELQLSSYWQNNKFSRYCPKFHIFTNIVIFQVYLQLFRPTASSLLILWQGHARNTLFHFCQSWAVKAILERLAGVRTFQTMLNFLPEYKFDFSTISYYNSWLGETPFPSETNDSRIRTSLVNRQTSLDIFYRPGEWFFCMT